MTVQQDQFLSAVLRNAWKTLTQNEVEMAEVPGVATTSREVETPRGTTIKVELVRGMCQLTIGDNNPVVVSDLEPGEIGMEVLIRRLNGVDYGFIETERAAARFFNRKVEF